MRKRLIVTIKTHSIVVHIKRSRHVRITACRTVLCVILGILKFGKTPNLNILCGCGLLIREVLLIHSSTRLCLSYVA